MATVKTTSAVLAPRSEAAATGSRAAPPRLLRCLVVSLHAERRRVIRAAAEAQAWDAIVCRDAGEFLRTAFKRCVPLVVVDLPAEKSADYWDLRHAAERSRDVTRSLIAIAGTGADPAEEVWARSLGAWAYLSEAHGQRGFEFLLQEAREALDRSAVLLNDEV
jgi:hypothetical protein